jgi:CubicO group peptidase (beta-lactamase class C family)
VTSPYLDTDIAHPQSSPNEAGIDVDRLDDLIARAQRDIDAGTLPSCQLAVARNGRLVAQRTLGDAAADSRYTIYSCTKGLMAGVAWRVLDQAGLAIDTTVANVVPEFGTNGKEVVTIAQVMTHTCGFPLAPFAVADWDDRERRLARFGAWRLDWEPGSQFVYHPGSAHWILAEVIERLAGGDFRDVTRAEVLDPLGLSRFQLGVPDGDQADINDVVSVGTPMSAAEIETAIGVAGIDLGDDMADDLIRFNTASHRRVGVPGGGGVSTAAELAMLYQAYLSNPADRWDAEMLRRGTAEILCDLPDPMVGVAANRSLGLVIAGDDGQSSLRLFGSTVSGQTFGAMGAGGQLAWADPATGISFAYLTNGLDAHFLNLGRRGSGLCNRAGVLPAD